jgi:hypothetical protein
MYELPGDFSAGNDHPGIHRLKRVPWATEIGIFDGCFRCEMVYNLD